MILSYIMQNTFNDFLRYSIITGLAAIAFIPLYVANPLFFPFITGKAFAFRIIVEIVFALWLILLLREKGTDTVNTEKSVIPKINSLTISITVFTIITLIADIAGLNPLRSIWSNFERMEGWMIIIHLWAYFMVLSSVLTTKENWYKFFNVVLVSGAITAFYGLFQYYDWAVAHQGDRVDASLGNAAYMAIYMLLNACLAAYMALVNFTKNSRSNILSWIYVAASALFSFVMFQTATRGTIIGWTLAVIVACGMYAIFGRKEKGQSNTSRMIAGGLIVLIFLSGFLFYKNRNANWIQASPVLGRMANISLSDTKTQARGFIWPMAVKGVFESPKSAIIGIGQENFNYIFNSHYNPLMYGHEQWFDRAHSVFLDWLAAGGLLGLLAYLALYVLAFISIIKSNITIGQKSILTATLVGYGIHNIFVFDNQTSYIMFFTFLAYIHSFNRGKVLGLFKNHEKKPSEDWITVRDYILVPLALILLVLSLYFINIRSIQANARLIDALVACTNTQAVSVKSFENALKLNQTMANQEIREQLLNCASNIIQNPQVPETTKTEFYTLAQQEVVKHITAIPNDARMYIMAGTFFNNVGDPKAATSLLEKANELSPNKQSIVYELATNYFNIGRIPESLALLEKAYLSAPENYDAKVAYSIALVSAGQEAKAQTLFADEPGIFKDPRMIMAYMTSKQYGKAIEIYKKMIEKNPEDQKNYPALAYVYVISGQNSLAILTLEKMQLQFPTLKTQIDALIKQIREGTLKIPN